MKPKRLRVVDFEVGIRAALSMQRLSKFPNFRLPRQEAPGSCLENSSCDPGPLL